MYGGSDGGVTVTINMALRKSEYIIKLKDYDKIIEDYSYKYNILILS